MSGFGICAAALRGLVFGASAIIAGSVMLGAAKADTIVEYDDTLVFETGEYEIVESEPGDEGYIPEEDEFTWEEPEYEDWIAWSGLPIDEDGVMYAFSLDDVKRGSAEISAVPLPGAGLLLIGGIAGIAALRRRGA